MREYLPRNDFVILRLEILSENKQGLAIPSKSDEAHKWSIHAVGPDVKDLNPGDVVQAMGTQGEDLARLPREKDLWITKQANILLVVRETEEEDVSEAVVSDK